jgi:hypothetical protein
VPKDALNGQMHRLSGWQILVVTPQLYRFFRPCVKAANLLDPVVAARNGNPISTEPI